MGRTGQWVTLRKTTSCLSLITRRSDGCLTSIRITLCSMAANPLITMLSLRVRVVMFLVGTWSCRSGVLARAAASGVIAIDLARLKILLRMTIVGSGPDVQILLVIAYSLLCPIFCFN